MDQRRRAQNPVVKAFLGSKAVSNMGSKLQKIPAPAPLSFRCVIGSLLSSVKKEMAGSAGLEPATLGCLYQVEV